MAVLQLDPREVLIPSHDAGDIGSIVGYFDRFMNKDIVDATLVISKSHFGIENLSKEELGDPEELDDLSDLMDSCLYHAVERYHRAVASALAFGHVRAIEIYTNIYLRKMHNVDDFSHSDVNTLEELSARLGSYILNSCDGYAYSVGATAEHLVKDKMVPERVIENWRRFYSEGSS